IKEKRRINQEQRRRDKQDQRNENEMEKIAERPAEWRRGFGGEPETSRVLLRVDGTAQRIANLVRRLVRQGGRLAQVARDSKPKLFLLAALAHGPPTPIGIVSGGPVLVVAHPADQLGIRRKVRTVGKNAAQPGSAAGVEFTEEIVVVPVEIPQKCQL